MKTFLIGLALLSSTCAFACEPQEAQFIGKVKNHTLVQRSESQAECTFEIEFSMFNPSGVCPLVPGEVSVYTFQDTTCSMKDGDDVSGVLVRRGSFVVIE